MSNTNHVFDLLLDAGVPAQVVLAKIVEFMPEGYSSFLFQFGNKMFITKSIHSHV